MDVVVGYVSEHLAVQNKDAEGVLVMQRTASESGAATEIWPCSHSARTFDEDQDLKRHRNRLKKASRPRLPDPPT